MPFGCPKLKFHSLSNTQLSTLDLGLTPNLQKLDLKDCHYLVEIKTPFGCPKKFLYLYITGCQRFESLSMEKLLLVDDGSLSELYVTVESFDVWPLHAIEQKLGGFIPPGSNIFSHEIHLSCCSWKAKVTYL